MTTMTGIPTEDMVLADLVMDGKPRKVILHADRNGFFYVLDRTNGKLLLAKPFVRQTWNNGFDANGRPMVDPKSVATPTGQVVFPAVGGTNFQAPSYDDAKRLILSDLYRRPRASRSARRRSMSAASNIWAAAPARRRRAAGRRAGHQGDRCQDRHGDVEIPDHARARSGRRAGHRGGVVFAATAEGQFIALDAKTASRCGISAPASPITASPISYAVDGQQYRRRQRGQYGL